VEHEGPGDERVATVLRVLDAYRAGDLAGMQHWMALEVKLEAVGNNPLAGTYEGLGGVMAYIGRSMGTFETGSVKVESTERHGDEVRVIVTGEVGLREGGTSTVRVQQRYGFREDGRIVRIRTEAAEDPEEFDRLIRQARRT
jgi:ketosteroid isomerase-like protein